MIALLICGAVMAASGAIGITYAAVAYLESGSPGASLISGVITGIAVAVIVLSLIEV